ncbi:50S ribosomal protein L7/L12 [Bienertia sinuspersici]
MRAITNKIPSKILLKRIFPAFSLSSHSLSTSIETKSQKLDRIANELLSLNPVELHDYSILFGMRMGLKNSALASLSAGASPSGSAPPTAEAEPKEKTLFDVKLEKFDAGAKIKIIKEVRSFTDLGLKEAKDMVEKAPGFLKKGVTKEEGEAIVEKLKAIGATVVLE